MAGLSNLAALFARLAPALVRGVRQLPLPKNLLPSLGTQGLASALSQLARGRPGSGRTQRARRRALQSGFGQASAGLGNLFAPGAATLGGFGGGLAQLGGGAGLVTGALIGGPIGAAAGLAATALGNLSAAALGAVEKLQLLDRSVIDANIRIGEFSSAMNLVQTQQTMFDIGRSQRRGDVLAPSANLLVQQTEAMNRSLELPMNLLQTIKNLGLYAITREVTGLTRIAELMLGAALKAVGLLDFLKANPPGGLEKFVEQKGTWAENYGKPPRMYYPP